MRLRHRNRRPQDRQPPLFIGPTSFFDAAGPSAGRLAALAGLVSPLRPGSASIVGVEGRLTDIVINGSIQRERRSSFLSGAYRFWAATLSLAKEPRIFSAPADQRQRISSLSGRLVPAAGRRPVSSVSSADPAADGRRSHQGHPAIRHIQVHRSLGAGSSGRADLGDQRRSHHPEDNGGTAADFDLQDRTRASLSQPSFPIISWHLFYSDTTLEDSLST